VEQIPLTYLNGSDIMEIVNMEKNMSQYKNPEVQKHIMLQYLQLMIAREDWHGVADAAMDLRDMSVEVAMAKTNNITVDS
jgi:hypothetical protein